MPRIWMGILQPPACSGFFIPVVDYGVWFCFEIISQVWSFAFFREDHFCFGLSGNPGVKKMVFTECHHTNILNCATYTKYKHFNIVIIALSRTTHK